MTSKSLSGDEGILGAVEARGPPYQYQYVQLHAGEIRLLRRIRTPSDGASSVYLLEKKQLSNKPQYQALSYTWGTPFDTKEHHAVYDGIFRKIQIAKGEFDLLDGADPAVLDAGRNLFEAINVFFNRYPLSYLWADALCINQTDLEERAVQVSLMESIYRQSEQVFVWLGAGCAQEHGIARIVDTLVPLSLELSSLPVREPLNFSRWLKEHKLNEDEVSSFPSTVQQFLETTRWLRRAWVVQEVVSATSIKVQLGILSMDWERFQRVLKTALCVAEYTAQVEVLGVLANRRKVLDRIDAVRADVKAVLSRPTRVRAFLDRRYPSAAIKILGKLLENTTMLEATEPQDRLYFAFGIFTSCLGNANLEYQLPEISYTKFRRSAHGGEISLFRMLGRTRGQRIGLPSWVPDFSDDEQSNIDDDFPQAEHSSALHVQVLSGESLYDAELRISAGHFITITRKVSVDRFQSMKLPELMPGTLGGSWLRLVFELFQIYDSIQPKYKTGENRVEVMASVMFKSSVPLSPTAAASLFILISWMLRAGLSRPLEDTKLHLHTLEQLEELKAEIHSSEAQKWLERPDIVDDIDLVAMLFQAAGGSSTALDAIHVSNSGILGRCGRDCQEGDHIWVAPGLCCPYVLRPHGDSRYEIISQAYCYGYHPADLLQGFKDDDLQLIQLI